MNPGTLDRGPTELVRTFGFQRSVAGWLLTPSCRARSRRSAAPSAQGRGWITTTFASHYTATISLDDVVELEAMRSYARMRTGEKYLIDPSR